MKEVPWDDQIKSTTEIVQKSRGDISKILKELKGYSPDTYQFEELAGRITESLHQLDKNLLSLENISKDLFNRLSSDPVGKYMMGKSLTQEEYYILKAINIPIWDASVISDIGLNDYEVFQMFCYEDEERSCYINPGIKPSTHSPATGEILELEIGCAPEDLDINSLRLEQREFFKTYFPFVYKQFNREEVG